MSTKGVGTIVPMNLGRGCWYFAKMTAHDRTSPISEAEQAQLEPIDPSAHALIEELQEHFATRSRANLSSAAACIGTA